ncbi:XdhC family protein [Pseudomonas fluorescens]|nr:XdhC family protein [Pseudomonas fluorescens]
MKQLDLQVINQGLQWLERGYPVWLCTVLGTFGSAPRGPGSMLIARSSGESRGSLSGGCVEEDFIDRLGKGQFKRPNQIVRYGDGGLPPTISLPCGGILDVLVEHFIPNDASLDHLRAIENALEGHAQINRIVDLHSGKFSTGHRDSIGPPIRQVDSKLFIHIGPVKRLIIAGLSPVAEFCIEFGIALGLEVVVCDPRPEELARHKDRWPNARLMEILPAVFIANGGCHAATAVVALTHDPRTDDLTLMESIRTQAFYIGAMGSEKTSQKRLERLVRIGGLTEDEVRRISAPIGLNLGSKTPAEIALAVMADIVRVANGVDRLAL